MNVIVSPGNSWGLIFKGKLDGKDVFVQVIDSGVPIPYKYLCALGDHYLVKLKDGRRAIIRENLWGNIELSVSTEGSQISLHNFLVGCKAPDDAFQLKDSLMKCFIDHGLPQEKAQKEVNDIIKTALDHVLFQIDLNTLINQYCLTGKKPSILECAAVTAYTMESNLYKFLNADLRSTERSKSSLEKWNHFLVLFLHAIKCMKPVTSGILYRGLNNIIPNYERKLSPEREGIYWYTIASASNSRITALEFATQATQRGMLFEISFTNAYSVAWLSKIPSESECIFIPGSCFKITQIEEKSDHIFVKVMQIPSGAYFM